MAIPVIPPADLIDVARIHELKKLLQRTTGFTIHELVKTFRESVDASLKEITSALAEHDLSKISKQVHRVKGACLNIGAVRLAHFAEQVEIAAVPDGFADMSALLAQLPLLYTETLNALSETRKEII